MGDRRGYNRGTDWLSPAAYNALSREQKMALAARRRQQRNVQHPRRNRRRPRRGVTGYLRYQATVVVAMLSVILVGGWLTNSGRSLSSFPPKAQAAEVTFGFCHTGGGTNCVVDGDTLWFQGENIRIADIDAPETHDWRCPAEKQLGDRATERLHQLVNSGPITLQPIDRDRDVYGRKLRLVFVNGTSVGETLIGEGLAHRYVRGKLPWC
jgi:micrococcal nuclease